MLLKYIVAFIGLSQSAQAGLYSSSSPVLQVNTPADFDTMVLDTNHTSVVEFYAPWCGHCKTLAPQFDKSARKMEGIVNFVAVDCDRGKLKPLCAKYGIRGFPTVKSFRRGKTPAKGSKTTAPTIEDYEGARNVKSLVRYAETKIRNHVTLINKAPAFESFLSTAATPRVVLVSQKATTTPDLLKALAIDFIDTVAVAYVPGKSASGVVPASLTESMTKDQSVLALWTSSDAESYILYDGEMTKKAIYTFLAGHAEAREGPLRPVSNQKAKFKRSKKSKKGSHDEL